MITHSDFQPAREAIAVPAAGHAWSAACLARCEQGEIERALQACAGHPIGDGTLEVVARDGTTVTLLHIPACSDGDFPSRTTILMPEEWWVLDPVIWDLHFGHPGLTSVQSPPAVAEPVLITGNTYPVREALKALGGRWDGDARGWRVPASQEIAARALVAKAGPASKAPRRGRGGRRRRSKGQRAKRSVDPQREIYLFSPTAKVGDCVPSPSDPSARVKIIRIELRNVSAGGASGWTKEPVCIATPVRASRKNRPAITKQR